MENLEPNTVYIQKENESYIRVFADPSIMQELSDHFTFEVPNARFTPKFRAKIWDGKIRLLDLRTKRLYYGLLAELENVVHSLEYTLIKSGLPEREKDEDSLILELHKLIKELNIHSKGKPIQPYDFQIKAAYECIKYGRKLIVSPTASGKSLIIYILFQWYLKHGLNKLLLVVPRTSLVEQMFTDFADYASEIDWNAEEYCHRLYQGKSKNSSKSIIITTWQSIYNSPLEWFKKFQLVVGDEAHGFQATSLIKIITNLVNCKIRIGTTGTIQDTKVHHLVLQGLFGDIFVAATTKELQDKNIISDILVKCIILNYKPDICKKLAKIEYDDEIKFLENHNKRNNFIRDLLYELKGNTLVLFKHLEHGQLLFDIFNEKCKRLDHKRKVFYICGETDTLAREKIRKLIETEEDAIIFATFGTFKEGININRLHNTFYAIPIKSPITTRQSIGRGLRKGAGKDKLNHYDVIDNLCHKSYKNHSWNQGIYRLKLYTTDQFKQKFYKINI